MSILAIFLAALGLSFLVFIHELGHYFMARREGMKVEIFSVGFGKPLLMWEHKGVKWQICWIPFGGYVRIAGMEKKGNLEPYEIPNGFYGKRPLARIKVALMGPIVNLVFGMIGFIAIWIGGGRLQSFAEHTQLIGWLDRCSNLYQEGIREGDRIETIGGRPFEGFNSLIYASIIEEPELPVTGTKIDYQNNLQTPFTSTLKPPEDLKGIDKAMSQIGILGNATYLIYDRAPDGEENRIAPGSPMAGSGIEYGDRLIWADGQLLFSKKELINTVNDQKTIVTVQRGGKTFLARVPRVKISDLRISPTQRAELDDWHHEADLKPKVQELFYIPYNINQQRVVQGPFTYLNEASEETTHCPALRAPLEVPLEPGDQIVAVDGERVSTPFEMLTRFQSRHVLLIVMKEGKKSPVSWKVADSQYGADISWSDLDQIINSIGSTEPITSNGPLKLLKPITPLSLAEYPLSQEARERLERDWTAQKKMIDAIADPDEQAAAMRTFEENQRRMVLGIALQDRQVIYNPNPWVLFTSVFDDTWRTLAGLFSGQLSPKWMSGPVGIVQVMHHSWTVGFKEALYWLAVISINLGIINLFPIPVLDGGHICFALWEQVTKKPLKAKTMERLIIPFIILIVAFFLYLTYNDLLRLFTRFF